MAALEERRLDADAASVAVTVSVNDSSRSAVEAASPAAAAGATAPQKQQQPRSMPFNCHFYLYNLSVVIFYISHCITAPALWTISNLEERAGQDPLDIITDFYYQLGYIIRSCVSAVTILVQVYVLASWLAVARRSTSKLQLLLTGVPLLIMLAMELIQAGDEPLYFLRLAGDSLSYTSMLLMWGVKFHGVLKVRRSHLQLRLFLGVQLFLHMVFSGIELLCNFEVEANETFKQTGAMYLVRQPVVDPAPRRPSFAQPFAPLSTPSPLRSLQLATPFRRT